MSAPTIAHSGQWTLGVLIGLPAAILGALLLLGLAVFFWYLWATTPKGTYSDRSFWICGAVGTTVAFILFVPGMVWGFWPLDSAYHQYRDVHGTVDQISSRFIGDGKSTSQKFVVTLEGSSQPFGVNDTRAALLKHGDPVSLRCIRVWEYGSDNAGYDCKWGAS